MAPTNGCRFSVLVMLRAAETLGEALTQQDGTPYDRARRTTLMRHLRKLGGERTGKGINAPSYNRPDAIHAFGQAFPSGEAIRANDRPPTIKANLADGWAYSISGNVSETRPGSSLRDNVNVVGHELGLRAYSYSPDDDHVDVWEPMTPACWVRVPWRDVRDFSSAYRWDQGRRVCIRVKTGADTAQARTRGRLADAQRELTTVKRERNVARRQVTALEARVVLLEAQVDNGPDAAWEAAHVASIAWHEDQRTAGPGGNT